MGVFTRLSLSVAFLLMFAFGSVFPFSVIYVNSQTTLIMIYLVSFLFSHGSKIMCGHIYKTHKVLFDHRLFYKNQPCDTSPLDSTGFVSSASKVLPAGQHSLIQSSGWLRWPISGMGHNWFSHSPIPRNSFYTTICTETNMKTDNEKHSMFWWFIYVIYLCYFPLESVWEGTASWKRFFCLFLFLGLVLSLYFVVLCVGGWLDSEPRALRKPGKCSTTGLCL